MSLDLPALLELCEKATPGPWRVTDTRGIEWEDGDLMAMVNLAMPQAKAVALAAYIAALSPEVVAALVRVAMAADRAIHPEPGAEDERLIARLHAAAASCDYELDSDDRATMREAADRIATLREERDERNAACTAFCNDRNSALTQCTELHRNIAALRENEAWAVRVSGAARDEAHAQTERAEAAEARVAELEADAALLRDMIKLVMGIPGMSDAQLEQLKANARLAARAAPTRGEGE